MRLLIIENEIIVARFIEQQVLANFDCTVRIAVNSEETLEIMPDFLPHILLCDIHLDEETDGIELVMKLQKQYSFKVIFITSYQLKTVIDRASKANPANFIIKPVDEARIYAGLKLVTPLIANLPEPEQIDQMEPSLHKLLNATELKVLELILERKTTKEIAAALFLSPYTIKNHRHRICRKLNLKDENNALLKWALAREGRIIRPE